jgi:hypothetical protein
MSSVNNALRLILLFRKQPSVRLTEAREYLDVAHSTTHRLLANRFGELAQVRRHPWRCAPSDRPPAVAARGPVTAERASGSGITAAGSATTTTNPPAVRLREVSAVSEQTANATD